MNLRQLHVFVMVVETGSMSETARRLYMTQPSVSQTIAELEESLQAKLFERINKKLIKTDAGEVLYTYSKRILKLVEEAESNIKDITNLKAGKLRLGASTTIGTYVLPKIIGDFKRKYEEIEVQFTIDNSGVIEEMILDHQIDIGLVEGPVHSRDIVVHYLLDDELYLVCSRNHHWVKDNLLKISPEQIAREALILREKGSGTREVVEEVLTRESISFRTAHVLNNTEAIKKAVEAGIGISFVSKLAVQEEIRNGSLVKIEVQGIHMTRTLSFIYHKEKFRSPLFQAFITYLNSYANH